MKLWGSLVVASVLVLMGTAVVADAHTLTQTRANTKARVIVRQIASERGALPKLARKNCHRRISAHRFKCTITWVPRFEGIGICVGTISVFYKTGSDTVFATAPAITCGFGGPVPGLDEGSQ